MKKYRVIHVGTGATGREALRTILQHPKLELIGHYAHSSEKIGKDSGELAGLAKAGIITTNNWGELLTLGADCLMYAGNGMGREQAAVEDMVPFLEAGTNVVTTSLIPMIYPPTGPAEIREPLAAACAKGDSSFLNSGIDPGYANLQLPISLLSVAGRVGSVRMREISCYGKYPVVHTMCEIFGFGKPLDFTRPIFAGGVEAYWRGCVAAVASTMELELDEIKPVYEVAAHDQDVDTAFGRVPKGTTAGVRFQLQGMVDGEPRIIAEHVSRAHVDVAPHWPMVKGEKEQKSQYLVIISGDPGLVCRLEPEDMTDEAAALKWTANHPINAIPSVCDAPAGLVDPVKGLAPFVSTSLI